jgi:ribonuclease P protein subunit POP4
LFKANFIELCGSVATTNTSVIQQRLIRADLHGAFVLVVKSTNPQFVNKSGFIIKETQKTFVVITKQDKVISIPKQGSIFNFDIQFMYGAELLGKSVKFDQNGSKSTNYGENVQNIDINSQIETSIMLYGSQFCIRPFERPTRKWKVAATIEMG